MSEDINVAFTTTPVKKKKSEYLDSDGNLKDNYKTNIKYGSEGIKTHNTIKRLCKDLKAEPDCIKEEEEDSDDEATATPLPSREGETPPEEDIRLEDERDKLKLKEEKLKEAEHEIHRLKREGRRDKRLPKEKKRNEKLGKLKEHISNRLKKFEEIRTKLRKKIKDSQNQTEIKENEEELKKINEHIHHFEKEETKIKKEHPKDKYEKKSKWERFRSITNSEYVSLFVFYCAVSLFVFSATAIIALTSTEYQAENKNKDGYNKFIGIGSVVYFSIFVLLLALSFGKEKDIAEKISSFVLLTGAIFVGLFFTYMEINKNFVNLTKTEKTNTTLAILVTFGFILYAIYFDLFERRNGNLENDIRLGYVALSVVLFFIIGGMTTTLAFTSKYKDDKVLEFLFHLSAGLFVIGCLLAFAGFLSYFKSVDDALSGPLDLVLNFIDMTKFKIYILVGLIISIYNTYAMYESYSTLTDEKLKNSSKKIHYRDNIVEHSFYAGIALIFFFLMTLAFCFGGSLKERLFSVFLIFFIVYVGGMILWFDGENRINAKGTEEVVLRVTEVIVGIILLTAIWYVLFKAKTSKDETLTALSRIIISISAIIYGLYSSGVNAGTLFKLKPSGNLKRELIASFVLGCLFVLSFFLLFI
tara:strand:- start:734 stop:2659 length:1926 start_codon:yes stop_codon:yes gene_type:complete